MDEADRIWPFPTIPKEKFTPRMTEELAFLEGALADGYQSFGFGLNNYGARSHERQGIIIERGRSWCEIVLVDRVERGLAAYVDDFQTSGEAVRRWLGGASAKEVLATISSHLISPGGVKASHHIYPE